MERHVHKGSEENAFISNNCYWADKLTNPPPQTPPPTRHGISGIRRLWADKYGAGNMKARWSDWMEVRDENNLSDRQSDSDRHTL